MTARQLERLLRRWQNRLGLTDYRIKVKIGDPSVDEANDAMCLTQDNYKEALICFGLDWDAMTDARAEYIVVHELLHVVTHPFCWWADEVALKEIGNKGIEGVADRVLEHVLEGVVDHLAAALVRELGECKS